MESYNSKIQAMLWFSITVSVVVDFVTPVVMGGQCVVLFNNTSARVQFETMCVLTTGAAIIL